MNQRLLHITTALVLGLFTAGAAFGQNSQYVGGISSTVGTLTVEDEIILGETGIEKTHDSDGAITFLGLGDGADESVTLNLDDFAGQAVWTSSTGANWLYSDMDFDVTGTNTQCVNFDSGNWVMNCSTDVVELADAVVMEFGPAGVSLTRQGNGIMRFQGLSGTQENLDIDLSQSNEVNFESNSGMDRWIFNDIAIGHPIQAVTVANNGLTTFAVQSALVELTCTDSATNILTITGGFEGMILRIINSDVDCTLVDDDTSPTTNELSMNANRVGDVDRTITLVHNGTYWLQLTQSNNDL